MTHKPNERKSLTYHNLRTFLAILAPVLFSLVIVLASWYFQHTFSPFVRLFCGGAEADNARPSALNPAQASRRSH